MLTVGVLLVVSVLSGRKVKDAMSFTTGGKAGGWMVCGAILGTLVGGQSTIGTAQLAFAYGLSAWWFTIGAALGALVLGVVYAGPLRRSGCSTLMEVVRKQYGRRAEMVGSTLFLVLAMALFASCGTSHIRDYGVNWDYIEPNYWQMAVILDSMDVTHITKALEKDDFHRIADGTDGAHQWEKHWGEFKTVIRVKPHELVEACIWPLDNQTAYDRRRIVCDQTDRAKGNELSWAYDFDSLAIDATLRYGLERPDRLDSTYTGTARRSFWFRWRDISGYWDGDYSAYYDARATVDYTNGYRTTVQGRNFPVTDSLTGQLLPYVRYTLSHLEP